LQYLTTLRVNDSVALDAGCLGLTASLADQAAVRHVFLSHSHVDHHASLPLFLINVHGLAPECPVVHAEAPVLDCLRRDLFNGRVWPDLVGMSEHGQPFVRLSELRPGVPVEVEGLRLTPVRVAHTVPTVGYLVEDRAGTVVFSADTSPTEELWERANRAADLRAVFLELTFPDALADLAGRTGHLTPATFAAELRKLARPAPAFAVHLHPRWREHIVAELEALALPGVQVGRFGVPYAF
jgi:ribonuclease BN (tRNA processing enzyme)